VPEVRTGTVPSILSVAVAPASVYVSPAVMFVGLSPFIVITGGEVSGVDVETGFVEVDEVVVAVLSDEVAEVVLEIVEVKLETKLPPVFKLSVSGVDVDSYDEQSPGLLTRLPLLTETQ
jgi:hypothetical protein